MIDRIFAAGVSAIALAIATPAFAQDAAPATAAEAPMPTMSFGQWGFDPSDLDRSVEPGDDFFAYANGKWIAANPLPPEFSRFGSFNLLNEKSTSDVKALIDGLVARDPASLTADERRIVDAYNAYLDTDAIDAAGLAPVQPYLATIKGAETLGALAALWGKVGYPSPVGGYVSVDQKEPDRYSVYFGSGGLGLPDRDYYLDETDKGKAIQASYRDYLAFLLGEGGYADAAGTAQAVYDFEDQIARKVTWDRATRRNRDLTYNRLTPEEMGRLSEGFPMAALLASAKLADTDRYILSDMPPSPERASELGLDEATLAKIGGGTPAMLALLQSTPVATLQAWMVKNLLNSNAAVLPSAIDDANFAFYGKTLTGTPEQRPRWKRATAETERLMGELVGAAYVKRYFPAENKVAMVDLVANLRKALALSIGENDWMSEATKK